MSHYSLSPQNREEVVDLCLNAFPNKFLPLFHSPQEAKYVLLETINSNRLIVTTSNNKVIGLLGYSYRGQNFFQFDWNRISGLIGRSSGKELHKKIRNNSGPYNPNDFYLETIAVDPSYQHQGIGTNLIDHVLDIAYQSKAKKVSLDVHDDNESPKQLYEQLGFTTEFTWMTKPFSNNPATTFRRMCMYL